MKSIFNFRPLFIIFLGFIFGAIYYEAIANISNQYWLSLFIVLTIFLVLMIIYTILGGLNLKQKFFKYLHQTYHVWLTLFLSVIIFGAIFSFACALQNSKLVDIDGKVSFSGKITNAQTYDNYVNLELKDVTYIKNSEKKLNSNLNLIVYTNGITLDYSIGNVVKASGYINKKDVEGYNLYNYSAIYNSKVSVSNVTIEKGKPNIFEWIKLKTKSVLDANMSDENSAISYAMLFGEKEGIDNNISNIFSISGISHILAVSGLHVGVLVSFILFILKKCKSKNSTTMIVLSSILLCYMILCGFTASVVRASVMALIMTLASVIGKRYDSLSSLSLAGIVILLFNPFAMFQIGFQLSFACVFAITTLSPLFNKMFNKMKIGNDFTKTISLSLSTSLALMPFCAHYFGRISLLSVITNVFVIPLFSITYILLFIFTILSVVINFAGVLLNIPELLIHFIKLIANFVANLKYSYVLAFDVSLITFVLTLGLEYVIHFMVANKIIKITSISVVSILLLISLIIDFMPYKYQLDGIICFNQYYGNMSIVLSENKEVTLVGYNSKDYSRLTDTLKEFRINEVKHLILYDTESSMKDIETFVKDYKVENVYVPLNFSLVDIKNSTIHIVDSSFVVGTNTYSFIENKDVIGVSIFNSNKYSIVGNNFSKSDLVFITNLYYNDIRYIIANTLTTNYDDVIDYYDLVCQDDNDYDANIVLNKQKIWYSYI